VANRAGRSFVRSRAPKRQTDWGLSIESVAPITVAPATKVLLATFAPLVLSLFAPSTIVRTRGYLTVVSDQRAVIESQIGGFGVAFVNSVAAALGVTGLPGPTSDDLFDGWFVHKTFGQQMLSGTDVAFQQTMASDSYEIDSKAMRKFDSDMALVVMVENSHATQAFEVLTSLRFLVKAG